MVGELNMVGVTTDGHFWHTIRRQDGTWLSFGDIQTQAGERGNFVAASCVALDSGGIEQLHVCGATSDGHLWHTIRRPDGTWFSFGDVQAQTGRRGNFVDVDCAAMDDLHVCGVTSDGHLWHTIRRADGSWLPFGDVEAQAGNRGNFVRVSCEALYSGNAQELHVCGVTGDGRLWHTIRRADGSWFPFGDVEAQAGNRGSFADVGISGRIPPFPEGPPPYLVWDELHVCGLTNDGRVWHTIRRPDGSWLPFGDVEAQAGDRGRFSSIDSAVGVVSIAGGIEATLGIHVSGATELGHLWHTIRRPDGSWLPFGDVERQAGDRGRFRMASIASE